MSRKKALTKRQLETFQFIENFHKKNGCMPTYQEIAEGLGIHDSGAHINCKKLAEKGWIKQDRRPRMIKILD